MKKLLILLCIIGLKNLCNAQELESTSPKWTLGFSVSPDAYRYPEGDESRLHYQLTMDRHFSKYLVAGTYVGHQYRKSSFTSEYPIDPFTVKKIEYERTYIPIGLRFGFDLSSYFSHQLGWIKNGSKWEILLIGYGGVTIRKENILTPIDEGEAVEWSDFEGDDDMQYIAGINGVIRYYPTKNWGLFTELGYGPVGRYSFGVSYRLF